MGEDAQGGPAGESQQSWDVSPGRLVPRPCSQPLRYTRDKGKRQRAEVRGPRPPGFPKEFSRRY